VESDSSSLSYSLVVAPSFKRAVAGLLATYHRHHLDVSLTNPTHARTYARRAPDAYQDHP
jgi:hypothetical protein